MFPHQMNDMKPHLPGGPKLPGNRPTKSRFQVPRRQKLALIGVAGESVGVLAGAAGWKVSGEPAWIVMSVVSFALAIILLRYI
jgi:hypothetical protein